MYYCQLLSFQTIFCCFLHTTILSITDLVIPSGQDFIYHNFSGHLPILHIEFFCCRDIFLPRCFSLFFPPFHFWRIYFFIAEAGGEFYIKFEKSCLSPPTETKMSGKSSEYWTSFVAFSLFWQIHSGWIRLVVPCSRRISFVEIIGARWEEELCTDLSCFSRREIGKNKIMGRGVPPCHRQGCTDHITAP